MLHIGFQSTMVTFKAKLMHNNKYEIFKLNKYYGQHLLRCFLVRSSFGKFEVQRIRFACHDKPLRKMEIFW